MQLPPSCSLNQYSLFVSKVRKYIHEAELTHSPAEYKKNKEQIIRYIITKAVEECIKEDILRDFFIEHRKEAIDVSTLEVTEEEYMQVVADENYERGVSQGISQGINAMVNVLRSMSVDDDTIVKRIMSEFNVSEEKAREYL